MNNKEAFVPFHINANAADLVGNSGLGRYVLLPGSDGRAKEIAEHFNNLVVKSHPRGHHLYLGTLQHNKRPIDVAAISTGMGCPSMEIILHELFHLGAKRFLRVGTAGSLQPSLVKLGDIVNAYASVRDERTTVDYIPLSFPAIASYEFSLPILRAAAKLGLSQSIHTGIVHCKSSFYARQFGAGPQVTENKSFVNLLSEYGILASEMETAALFVQSQLYNHQLKKLGKGSHCRVLAGAVLAIITTLPNEIAASDKTLAAINNVIHLALEAIKELASVEMRVPELTD